MDTKVCPICHKEFSKPYNLSRLRFKRRIYCSRACSSKDWQGRTGRLADLTCGTCGKEFRPKNRGQKYCSFECSKGRFKGRQGPKHPAWKGGRHITATGYLSVWIPNDHPFAAMRHNGRYVLEHRLIMAEHLGRVLAPSETVHHKNGDRTDNRIENLQMRQGKHGNGQRHVCADCGSENVRAVPL